MKKSVKIAILLVVIALAIAFLVGCGNKLVATKSNDGYDEKVEIKFKGNNISEVKMTLDFEKEEAASLMYQIFSAAELEGLKAEQKGNRVIITMDGKSYFQTQGEDQINTKEEVKKALEEQGYKVK